MAPIDSNRLSSASVTGNRGSIASRDSEPSVGSAGSARALGHISSSAESLSQASKSSFGRSVRSTMPQSPSASSTRAPQGLESVEEGLAKTTRAKVDVARRSFWGKCLSGVIVTAGAGLGLFALATGAAGAVAGAASVGLALFAIKSLGDATLSFMNWRNKKAELLGQPPPYPKINNLPEKLREDAMGAALFAKGVSASRASLASKIIGSLLGLASVSGMGYASAGWWGVGLYVAPVLIEEAAHAGTHWIEHQREAHTERTVNAMSEQSKRTMELLEQLELQVMQLELNPNNPASQKEVDTAKSRLEEIRTEVKSKVTAAQESLQQRVERKHEKGVAGVGALAADIAVNHLAQLPDHLKAVPVLPVHALGVGVIAARAAVEGARLWRSKNRDDHKLQEFKVLHEELATMMNDEKSKILQRIAELDARDFTGESDGSETALPEGLLSRDLFA